MSDTTPVDDATPIEGGPPPAPKAPACPPGPPPFRPSTPPATPVPATVVDTFEPTGRDEQRTLTDEDLRPRRRRVRLPVVLFAITCVSTFWAGTTLWVPTSYMFSLQRARLAIVSHWDDGLVYMACVLAILAAHEMGHFVMTLRYRIPASLPFFLPLPITPIGTMGAVIGMDGLRANRRELFDIGLAGPLAGLVLAVPIMWIGIGRLDMTQPATGPLRLDAPLLVRMMLDYVQPPGYTPGAPVAHLNPYFMAGWVGLLITGLNMLPVSQLDGGHVVFALFGKRARWIARGFLVSAIFLVVLFFNHTWVWMPMVVLVTLLGVDHPPSSDDTADLGWFRRALGYASLAVPFLCFPAYGLWEKTQF